MLNRPPETLGSPRSETAASPNLVEFYGGSVRRPSSFTLLPPNNGATNDSLLHNSVLGQSGLRRSSFTRRSFAAGGVVSVGTSFNNSTLRHRPSLTSSSAFGQFMPETPSTLGGVSSTKVLTPRDGRIPPIAPVSAASPPRLAEEEGSQSPRPLIQAQPSLDVDTLAATKTSSLTGSADVSLNCSPMIRTPSGAGAKAVRMMFGSKPRDDDSNTPLPTAPPLQLEAPPPPMPPRKVHGSRGVAAVLGSRAQPASPVQLPVSALKSPYSRQRSDSVLSLEASPIPMPPAESRDPSVRPAMRPNHADNPGSPSGNILKTFAAFGASPPCPDLQPSPVVKRLVDGDVSVTLIEALDDDEFDGDDDDPEAITFDSADNSPLAHNIGLVEVVRPAKNRSSKTASSSSGATTGKRRDTLSVANTAGSNRSPHSPRSPLEEMLGSTLFTSKHDNAGHKMNMSFSSNRIDDDNGDPDTVNNFSFYGKIGEGACGVVFKALDEESLTEHAVKELKRPLGGPDNITEVRVMRALPQHPHVCPMLEIIDDVANKKVLMVMPLYAGAVAEVDAATFSCKALPPASVCAVAIQIGSALRHCHEHGIVHGDIKPENILTDGKPPRRHSGTEMSFQFPLTACLADFGASVICTSNKLGLSLRSRPDDESSDEEHDDDDDMHVESLRQMGLVTHVGGSPAYLAPEALIGMTKPTEMTDMWAFGVTLFALLFGAHPFPSESILELRDKVAHRPPQYPDSQRKTAALRPWRMILDGLLDKDPDKRWSADKLLTSTALARAVQALNTGASC